MTHPSHFINGQWLEGAGAVLTATDPATGDVNWTGQCATSDEIRTAVQTAKSASETWSRTPLAKRIEYLEAFTDQLKSNRDALATRISCETGKPFWESLSEADIMAVKIAVSIEAHEQRRHELHQDVAGATAVTRFKPHGTVAVLGPFNLPGHLPNGHIVPALLAGNTVVFKPSEQTPGVGQLTVQLWQAAGLPDGVINLVQGDRQTAIDLVTNPHVRGIFFTGGTAAGQAIQRATADQPWKILALEMGGNNPLVIDAVGDLDAAAYLTVQSAYITAGQRCTCARRLIVTTDIADALVSRLVETIGKVRLGPHTDRPEPFMGPVITVESAERLLAAQKQLVAQGGHPIVKMTQVGERATMLSPGLIDVTDIIERDDVEHFGPLLQLIRVPDFDTAISVANDTAFGLAASLFSDDASRFDQFIHRIQAGVVNWNRQTTGASGRLPFGGVGISGNQRPSGYHACDYCSYPVASLELNQLSMPEKIGPGIDP